MLLNTICFIMVGKFLSMVCSILKKWLILFIKQSLFISFCFSVAIISRNFRKNLVFPTSLKLSDSSTFSNESLRDFSQFNIVFDKNNISFILLKMPNPLHHLMRCHRGTRLISIYKHAVNCCI